MRTTKLAVLLGWLLLGVHAAPVSARVVDDFREAAWKGGAYLDDSTGEFQSCFVSGDYRNGISLAFLLSKDYVFSVMLTHPDWTFAVSEKFDLTMDVEEADAVRAEAEAIDVNTLIFDVNSTDRNLRVLRTGEVMTVAFKEKRHQFALTDTSRALPRLLQCVATYIPRLGEKDARVAFEVLPDRDVLEAGSSRAPQQREVARVMKDLVASTPLTGFEILSDPKQRKEFGNPDVLWRTDALIGITNIVEKASGETVDSLNTALLLSQSSACDGEFASAMKRENVLGSKVLVTSMQCVEAPGNKVTINQTLVPRKAGGFYVFLTVEKSDDGAIGSGHDGEEIRSAALKMVTEP